MSRKTARENALKSVYEFCIVKEPNNLTIEKLSSAENMQTEDIAYLKQVYGGIVDNYGELSAIIEGLSKGFSLERLYKIDLAILLIALYEIKYVNDIPQTVSINEALELSKLYSTEKSASFINGILAAYLKNNV